jgi:ubiquinone/menaquinone biosynthesis C-methylase UbiE
MQAWIERIFRMNSTDAIDPPVAQQGWLPQGSAPQDNPHMTLAFARAYEKTATRIMAPISFAALERIGPVGRETSIIDIAAGAGALSIPAAHSGASVTAVDIAPGMVDLLTERLAPFPRSVARVMDGQSLTFPDESFDAAASIVGISMFTDWRRGLAEQARVLRSGGRAAIASWRTPPGGGPFVIMAQALRTVLPDRAPPAPPQGFLVLAEPDRMAEAMQDAGFVDVEVKEIEAVWEGPAGPAYLTELRDLHHFMGPYAFFDADTRTRLDDAILAIVDRIAINDRVALTTTVVLATGTRP